MQVEDKDGRWLGTEAPERVVENAALRYADAQTSEVVRPCYGAVYGRNVPKSVFHEAAGHGVNPLGRKFAAKEATERAIHQLVDLTLIGKRERQALDLKCRHEWAQQATHYRVELDPAVFDLIDDFGVRRFRACVLGMYADIKTAAGLRAHGIP